MSSAGLDFHPGGLWSLWDLMIKFDVRLLIVRMNHLEGFEKELRGHMPPEERPTEPQMKAFGLPMWTSDNPAAFTTDSGRKVIWAHIGPMQNELAPLGLSASQLEILHIWNHADRWTRKQLADGFATLRWKIERELNETFFIFLDAGEAKFFILEPPFGEVIAASFRSADFDSSEAAKSYAVGRYTACVFHCMRVLECGLKALAANVERTFDRQQWHNILEEIESEIKTISKTGPKSAAKDDRVKWLSEAGKEFFYFKDGWRNYVSHGRSRYDGPQAMSTLEHVRAFMQHLATRLTD